jgi:hypothetical protein
MLLSLESKDGATDRAMMRVPRDVWKDMHDTTLSSSIYGDQFDWELKPEEENPE